MGFRDFLKEGLPDALDSVGVFVDKVGNVAGDVRGIAGDVRDSLSDGADQRAETAPPVNSDVAESAPIQGPTTPTVAGIDRNLLMIGGLGVAVVLVAVLARR